MQPGDWVIVRSSYGHCDDIGEVVKATAKQLSWKKAGYTRARVTSISEAVYSNADEAKTRAVLNKLKSARGEYHRRQSEVQRWHVARRAEIIAAANQGDE